MHEATVHSTGQIHRERSDANSALTCRKCRAGLDPDAPTAQKGSSIKQESSISCKVDAYIAAITLQRLW